MPCYFPRAAWLVYDPASSTKQRISFNFHDSFPGKDVDPTKWDNFCPVPCGKCIGCRLERSRQWAVRCWAESLMHLQNSFITLTYSDENLPIDGELHKEHLTLFLKRLRKFLFTRFGKTVRYFACGEYGSKNGRPHFHLCLFGEDFSYDRKHTDAIVTEKSCLYSSESLNSLWSYGNAIIGNLTQESAGYTARYCLKKQTGGIDWDKFHVQKSYCVMSRRPGIGFPFFEKYKDSIYSLDYLVTPSGVRLKPPKFFDKKMLDSAPEILLDCKAERVKFIREKSPDFEQYIYTELPRLFSVKNEQIKILAREKA